MDQPSQQKDSRLAEPIVLLFENSPFGTLDAIVQHDGKSVYFYLSEGQAQQNSGNKNVFGTRACWVRNLEIGPLVLNEDEMRAGISPMLPRTHCVVRESQPPPVAEQLRVVWLEEGNGAALLESGDDDQEEMIAMIPPWSGLEGFHGYAKECAMESPLCWPMPDNQKLNRRVTDADQFWREWNGASDPFAQLQPQILASYDAKLLSGKKRSINEEDNPKYFSIDGGNFPPRGMVWYQHSDHVVIATVGLSVCPQPAVELFTDDPRNHRRIELAIRLAGDFSSDAGQAKLKKLSQQLSGLAGYPWRNFTWLGAGHTCGLTNTLPNCESALLVSDRQIAVSPSDRIELPTFRDDPINLLWLVPIEPSVQQKLQDKELSVEAVIASHQDRSNQFQNPEQEPPT